MENGKGYTPQYLMDNQVLNSPFRLLEYLQYSSRLEHHDNSSLPSPDKYIETIETYFNSIADINHPKLSKTPHLKYLYPTMILVYTQQNVLFAIDVEAWERDNKSVTEIGIAIYDPRDENPLESIIKIHIRIKEHLDKRNGRYVPDNAEFALSGRSYVMTRGESVKFIQALVDYYFKTSTVSDFNTNALLVGHNVKGDVKWLRDFGIRFDPSDITVLDTQTLFASSNGIKGASLKNGLLCVEIPHSRLHNALNDAYYTLVLALNLCDPAKREFYRLEEFYGSRTYESNDTPKPDIKKTIAVEMYAVGLIRELFHEDSVSNAYLQFAYEN